MLWKCSVCGYMHEGVDVPEICPKCGQAKEKFSVMAEENAQKVFGADRTNDILMEIIKLSMKIKDLAKEGMEIGLDPNCVGVFKKAHQDAWVIKQRSKAEIEQHINKGKW